MRRRFTGRPRQRKPPEDLEYLGPFGRLVVGVCLVELLILLWVTNVIHPV